MTIRDVAVHLGVGWDLIKDIQKRDLSRRFAKPKLKHLRYIAIDEIAIAKGHRYLTIVMDLETGAVVFVGDGKGADALKPFWKRLRPSGAKITAVAMDMSAAYRRAVATNLPKAKIVFDRFHVVKLFNDKLSNLRRALHREATDVLHKQVLKGTRWLVGCDPLAPGIGEADALDRHHNIDPSRGATHLIKETFPGKICLGEVRQRCPEFSERLEHRPGVLGRRVNPKAQVLGITRLGILHYRIPANDQVADLTDVENSQ